MGESHRTKSETVVGDLKWAINTKTSQKLAKLTHLWLRYGSLQRKVWSVSWWLLSRGAAGGVAGLAWACNVADLERTFTYPSRCCSIACYVLFSVLSFFSLSCSSACCNEDRASGRPFLSARRPHLPLFLSFPSFPPWCSTHTLSLTGA